MKKKVANVLLAFLLSLSMIADCGLHSYAAETVLEETLETQIEESEADGGSGEASDEETSVQKPESKEGMVESEEEESKAMSETDTGETVTDAETEQTTSEEETTQEETASQESIAEESVESGESMETESSEQAESVESDLTESDEVQESGVAYEPEMLEETKQDETTEELDLQSSAYVPEKVRIEPTTVTMYEGDRYELTAMVYPETVMNASIAPVITWESSNSDVVNVITYSANSLTAYLEAKSTGVDVEKDVTITVRVKDANNTEVVGQSQVKVCQSDAVRNGDLESTGVSLGQDIWVTKIDDENLVYTGKEIKPEVRVYHKHKQLKENIDYKLEYKNAINASGDNGVKTAYVIVKMMGQYTGKKSVYYQIKPRPIYENGKLADGFTFASDGAALNFNNKIQKYVPTIQYKLDNGYKTLVNKKDFTIEYDNDSPVGTQDGEPLKVSYQIEGIGNFCTVAVDEAKDTENTEEKIELPSYCYYIVGNNSKYINLSKATVYLRNSKVPFTGKAITVADLGLTIKLPGDTVKFDPTTSEDFIVETTPLEEMTAGTQWITIKPSETGKEKYKGVVRKKYTLTGYQLKNTVTFHNTLWKSEITYSKTVAETKAGITQSTEGLLTHGDKTLVEGTDYTVTFSNNKKAGTAKATFKGIGVYAGTMIKTFKILANDRLTAEHPQTVAYTKGGTIPDFVVRASDGTELVKNKDYTVKVINNKAAGATAEYTIRGKGNYAKSEMVTGTYTVTAADISKCRVVVADKAYKDKADAYKSTPVVYDSNNKKLTAGRDYEKAYVYKSNDTVIEGIPTIGQEITVEIKGMGNYEGTVTGSYHIYEATKSISKLKITIDSQTYTGNAIMPSIEAGDIHVYLNSADQKNKVNEQEASNFIKVVSYSNNVNKGTGKVTLAGVGEYGGTKTYSFKIKQAELVDNTLKSISFSENMYRVDEIGQEVTVWISYKPTNAENREFEWTVSDETVATIVSVSESKESAVVRLLKKEEYCDLTVREKETGIKATCKLYCGELQGVLDYGAIPNDGKDDSEAFLKAIQAAWDKIKASSDSTHRETVYVPSGVYDIKTVDTNIILWEVERIDIVLEDGAVLKSIPNNRDNYDIVGFVMCNDCTITGGKIVGDREQHTHSGAALSEWGHCISLYKSTNIKISNVEICNAWGDGIWIGDFNNEKGLSTNITIDGCNIHHNRRNNISLTCAEYITINNCKLNNANGTDPQFGIDIETNYDDSPIRHVTLTNTEIKDNAKGAVGIITAADDVLLKNCDITGAIHNMRGDNVRLENTKVNGETKNGSIPREQ